MNATVSSIHVNGWYGAHTKLSGAAWIVRRLLGRDLDGERERWLYVGDSTNDELMFASFPLSVGVANLVDFADRLQQWPAYVTALERGRGFVEVAEALLVGARPDERAPRRAADARRRRGARARHRRLARPGALRLCAAAAADARRPRLELPHRRRDEHRQRRRLSRRRAARAALARGASSARTVFLAGSVADGAGPARPRPGRRATPRSTRCASPPGSSARRPSSPAACSPRGSSTRERRASRRARPPRRARPRHLLRRHRRRHRRRRRCSCRVSSAARWRMPGRRVARPGGARRVVATLFAARGRTRLARDAADAGGKRRAARASTGRAFAPALLAYLLFGLGYIGYMTFVITLLRERSFADVASSTAFFAMLGARRRRLVVALGRHAAALSRRRRASRC